MAKGKKRPAELPEYGTVMMKESGDLRADTRRIV